MIRLVVVQAQFLGQFVRSGGARVHFSQTTVQIRDLHWFFTCCRREVCKIEGAFQENVIIKHTSRILLC